MGAEFGEGLAVAVGWGGELGVAYGGAVASHVDGVHDREGAADSEAEADEEADDRRPVKGHYDGSLSRLVQGARESVCGDLSGLAGCFGGCGWGGTRARDYVQGLHAAPEVSHHEADAALELLQ